MILKSIRQYLHKMINIIQGEDLRGKLIKDSFGSLFVNVGSKLLSFIIGTLLVRILGDDGFGIYSYFYSLIYVLIIPIEFGISTLLIRETAKGIAENKPSLIIGIWRWSALITTILSTIIIIIVCLGSPLINNLFDNMETTTLYWGILLLPLQAFILLAGAILRGLKKVILGQLPDLLIIPGLFMVMIVVVVFLLPMELTASTAMALRMTATLIALIFCLILLARKTPGAVKNARPIYQSRLWLASVIPLVFSSGINMIKSRANILIMGLFVSAADIGTFQVAVSTASLAYIVLTAINSIIAPQFASLFAKGEINKLQRLVSLSARVVLIFNILITSIVIIFGKSLLTLVFGNELIDAYPSLIILLLGQLVNSGLGSVNILLNMTGHEKDVMKIILLSSLINIFITFILTPFFGIIFGAAAISISLIIAQVLMCRLVKQKLGIASHAFVEIHL